MMDAIAIEDFTVFTEGNKSYGLSASGYYDKKVKGNSADLTVDPDQNKTLIDRIKGFLAKIIAKVNEIINRAIAAIGKIDAAAFVKEYESKVADQLKKYKLSPHDDVYESKINMTNLIAISNNSTNYIKSMHDIHGDKFISDPDIYRGSIIGKNKCSAQDFPKELKKLLYGEPEKITISDKTLETAFNGIKNYKKQIDAINKSRKDIIADLKVKTDDIIKEIKTLKNKGSQEDLQKKNNELKYLKEYYSITLTVLNVYLRAQYDALQTFKAIVIKCVNKIFQTLK